MEISNRRVSMPKTTRDKSNVDCGYGETEKTQSPNLVLRMNKSRGLTIEVDAVNTGRLSAYTQLNTRPRQHLFTCITTCWQPSTEMTSELSCCWTCRQHSIQLIILLCWICFNNASMSVMLRSTGSPPTTLIGHKLL